jgi:hypothetical protein
MLVVQTVSVDYTQLVAEKTQNLANLIKLAISETNTAYQNSLIPIQLELRGTPGVVDVAETSDPNGMLDAFQALFAKTLATVDMKVLLVSSVTACGISIEACYNTETFSCFSLVRVDCATSVYAFGHELGHNQGAQHNMEAMPVVDNLDNHGLVLEQGYGLFGAYRTIMAYPIIDEAVIQYFSNPEVFVLSNGQLQATGIEGHANNARVITSTRYLIAQTSTSIPKKVRTKKPTRK